MYQFDDPDEKVTFESLQSQHRVISMEAGGLSQTFSALSSKFPRFVGDVKNFLTTTLNPFAPKGQLVDSRRLEKLFQEVDYVTASPLAVYVPAGFSGNWLDYTHILADGQNVLNTLQTDLLKPFETWLALMLNTPDLLADIVAPAGLARYKAPDMDKLKKAFGSFYTHGTQTESTYGKVLKRHADLPLLTRNLNEVNQHFVSINRADVIRQVEQIVLLLNTLMENAKEDPQTYRVSGSNARLLSDLTFHVAQEVSFYPTFGYQLEAFTKAVKDSYARLEENLTK